MLQIRNVTVSGRRTSIRLEPNMWDGVTEICQREGRTIHEICSMVEKFRRDSSFTAHLRVFIMNYFRTAATEEGHADAGHGSVAESGANSRWPRVVNANGKTGRRGGADRYRGGADRYKGVAANHRRSSRALRAEEAPRPDPLRGRV